MYRIRDWRENSKIMVNKTMVLVYNLGKAISGGGLQLFRFLTEVQQWQDVAEESVATGRAEFR